MDQMHQFAPTSPDDVSRHHQGGHLPTNTPLKLRGNRTKALGRPMTVAASAFRRAAMSGIHFYEPSELVVSARPGHDDARTRPTCSTRTARNSPSNRSTMAALYGHDPLAGTIGGTDRHQRSRPTPHQGRRGPRPPARLHRRQRPRRSLPIGRPRDEKRHRLRPLETDDGLIRHSRRIHRPHTRRCCPRPRWKRRSSFMASTSQQAVDDHDRSLGSAARSFEFRPSASRRRRPTSVTPTRSPIAHSPPCASKAPKSPLPNARMISRTHFKNQRRRIRHDCTRTVPRLLARIARLRAPRQPRMRTSGASPTAPASGAELVADAARSRDRSNRLLRLGRRPRLACHIDTPAVSAAAAIREPT